MCFDRAIIQSLTNNTTLTIRNPQQFQQQADQTRAELFETFEHVAQQMGELLTLRSEISALLETVHTSNEITEDIQLQLGFLFRPGFIRTPQLFQRYPRYLKALKIRLQRIRSNAQADLRKLAEIEPFIDRLSEKLLETETINQAHRLIEFAMFIEEFRVNRFAPEIKTPRKISAQRLEEIWQSLQSH